MILILIFFAFSLTGEEAELNPFETPDCLKDNVAFWKKIYAEISLEEGLIHDSEYPLVIYQKVTVGNLRGRQRRQVVGKYMDAIKQSLKVINGKPESQWSEKEKEIFALIQLHGDINDLKGADDRLRFQLGQKERFKEGVERAAAYLAYIRQVFTEYGIPLRIGYLPHVESSFNVNAYSKVGAAGMWQFMRRTGRLFMNVGYNVDERRDPFKSTVAAAKLLKLNYEELQSWPLAITAYNHGTESMKRAVELFETRDLGVIIENYKNRKFRFVSKNFYSCFLAASEIGANPEQYFSNLNYQPPIQYNEVTLDSYFKPAVLANHLGVSQQELAELNPALRPTVFRHQMAIPRGFRLRIPATISPQTAGEKIAAVPHILKSAESKDFQYYSVNQGDTLYQIALDFGVSTEMILAANDIERENRISIGQVLRIPGKNNPTTTKDMKNTGLQTPVTALTTFTTPSTSLTPATPGPSIPQIIPVPQTQSMETSQTPPTQSLEIQENKPLTHKPPRMEMKIAQPLPTSGSFDATLYNLEITPSPQKENVLIRVEVEETLGHYSDWLGISASEIRRLNGLASHSLKIGRKILLPMSENALDSFKTKRLEFHMALEEDFYNQYQVAEVNEYKVSYGETLWSICNGEIPLWLFKKYNRDLDMNKIGKNTKLNLPVIKSK